MTENEIPGKLIDQKLLGLNLLGEKKVRGVQLFFTKDDFVVYLRDDGKLRVLLNGKPIQGSD